MVIKAHIDKNGIVINPKYSTYFAVQETPFTQGAMLYCKIL
jgi:acyl-CoA thioesterase FadM